MRARKDLSDGIFYDNLFVKARMNALTVRIKRKPFHYIAFSPKFGFIVWNLYCVLFFTPFFFLSDILKNLRGHCQLGQKQLGSECICMSPEEDCR